MFSITGVPPESQRSSSLHPRTGLLNIQRSDGTLIKVPTPAFMPVATKGNIKLITNEEAFECGVRMMISNSFILYLRPGLDFIQKRGGIRGFNRWQGALFTDSGGFQVLSPDFLIRFEDNGIRFRSPYDGSKHLFSPEKSMEVQFIIGSDVAMALDHCPPAGCSKEENLESVRRTTEWASRCQRHLKAIKDGMVYYEGNSGSERILLKEAAPWSLAQEFFPICQGGVDDTLRERSASELASLNPAGFGIGGLRIGEKWEDSVRALSVSLRHLPYEKPKYLMGVGTPLDILESIALGVDIFDSVYPTRTARHGTALSSQGKVNLKWASCMNSSIPIDPDCRCRVCKNYKRDFISYLFFTHEDLAQRIVSYHNIYFIQTLLNEARERIPAGTFSTMLEEYRKLYPRNDDEGQREYDKKDK